MIRSREPIGTAIETVGNRQRIHRCYGTYRGDIPDPRFRFNILFNEHRGDFPVHSHEYAELTIVLGGSAVHITGACEETIAAGDVSVTHGDQRHGLRGCDHLQLCDVQFDPRQFLHGQRELHAMMGYHALFDLEPRTRIERRPSRRLRLTEAQLAHVASLLRGMKDEMDHKRDGRETVIRGTFLLLVTALARYYAAAESEPTAVVRMASVLSHIRRNLDQPLAVDELAKIACLSPSQFQRAFRKTYGSTPIQLVNRLRIDKACELLRDETRDIASIAAETGFATPSFFATQFRKIMGVSPSVYRRHAGGSGPIGSLKLSPAVSLVAS